MWTEEFKNLDSVKDFIIKNLSYNEKKGYTFLELYPGMDVLDVVSILGEPNYKNVTSIPQQLLEYDALIDHPTKGKLSFNKATLKFIAYNKAPLKNIVLHTSYSNVGEDAENHRNFIVTLINEIEEKFGKPDKKSLRIRKSNIVYQIGYSELYVWQKFDGLRVQVKDKSSM